MKQTRATGIRLYKKSGGEKYGNIKEIERYAPPRAKD